MESLNIKCNHIYKNIFKASSLFFFITLGAGCANTSSSSTSASTDFSGVWLVDDPSMEIRTSQGELPPLRSDALEVYNRNRDSVEQGDLSFDLVSTKCGMPGIVRMHNIPYPVQIFQNELRVSFVYEFNHNFRSVSITDQPGLAEWETAYGLGGAQFVDNTMVINTNGLIDETFLDSLGMPHSNSLLLTETFRLLDDGNRLEVTLGFEDPEIFVEPWTAVVNFNRLDGYNLEEDICLDRVSLDYPAIDWNYRIK